MRYKTYNKKPTKYRKAKRELLFVFILAATCVLINLITTPKQLFNEVKKEVAVIIKHEQKPPVIKYLPSIYGGEVEFRIREIADEMNFKYPDYLVRLAYCESRLDPKGINRNGNNPKTSYDRGLFQFNSHWQKKVTDDCAYNVDCATRTAIKMINEGKQHLWMCNNVAKR